MEKCVRNNFYRWVMYALLCFIFLFIGVALIIRTNSIYLGVLFLIVCVAFFAIAVVRGYVFQYYLWKSVYYEKKGDISPGKAIGFLFIPAFNIYWIFVFNLGLIKRLKRIRSENGLSMYIPSQVLAVMWILLPNPYFGLRFFGSEVAFVLAIITVVYGLLYYYFLMRACEKVEISRTNEPVIMTKVNEGESVFCVEVENKKKTTRTRKLFLTGFWLMVSTVIFLFLARKVYIFGDKDVAIILYITVCIEFILLCIFEGMLLYHLWYETTQDRKSASKAVGFLYIPFFNFYWHFASYVGLSKKIGEKIEQRNLPLKNSSKGFAIAYATLWCLTVFFIASSWYYIVLFYIVSCFIKWIFYFNGCVFCGSFNT